MTKGLIAALQLNEVQRVPSSLNREVGVTRLATVKTVPGAVS